MRNTETLDVSGHLQIFKVHKDGSEEKVFDDHNLITSGMGLGLAALLSGQDDGSASVKDFQIRWFNLGTSGQGRRDGDHPYDHTIYDLSGEYVGTGSPDNYGDDNYTNSTNLKSAPDGTADGTHKVCYIPDTAIKRSGTNSVTYILWVPEDGLNDTVDSKPLNEIGLWMNNPLRAITGASSVQPINLLVAYRAFDDIQKTDQFSLVFKWKITF